MLFPAAAAACASGRGAAPQGKAADAEAGGDAKPTHPALDTALWMQRSAEYEAVALQADRRARVALDSGLSDPGWSALPGQAVARDRGGT